MSRVAGTGIRPIGVRVGSVPEHGARPLSRAQAVARARPLLVGWFVSVLFWAAWMALHFAVRRTEMPLVGDEWFYWQISRNISNPVTLAGYGDPLRGVAYPALLSWLGSGRGLLVSGPRGVASVVTVLCVPLLVAVIAPSLARSLGSRTRVGVLRILALDVLVFAFWRNDTLRLLSDIPALTAFAGGVAILARLATDGQRPRWRVVGAGAAGGFLLAVGANTRPAYLAALVVAVVLVPLLRWRSPLRTTAVVAAAVVVGLALGFAPQVAVNRHLGTQWSIMPPSSSDLARLQLRSGLAYQRYDTYTGPADQYPSPAMVYDNSANVQGIDLATVDSTGALARAAIGHPVAVTETVARHAFNGLDIRWPGTYVDDLRQPMAVTQIPNFVVLLAAAWVLAIRSWRSSRRRRSSDRSRPSGGARPTVPIWFALVLAAATAPALIAAVETRFLLPLHLFLLAVVALGARVDDLPDRATVRAGALVGTAAAVVAAMAFSASVFTTLVPAPP